MSQSKPQLRLDWCSFEAAKYAVEYWHYSKCLPVGKMVKVGVWEDEKFIGCVLFSRGANRNMLEPFGIKQTQGCELTRVALTSHKTPVSKILSIAIKMLLKLSPGLRLIVSYADTGQDHHGGIYQASNWIYSGLATGDDKVLYNGELVHKRTIHSKYGSLNGFKLVKPPKKYRYLYPLDEEMKQQILPLAKPYPKKPCVTSLESEATTNPSGKASCNATVTLQSTDEHMLERVEVAHV